MASAATAKRPSAKHRRTAGVRWRPATLAAFHEADKLEADLVSGRTTKVQLIKEVRLFTSVEALLADLKAQAQFILELLDTGSHSDLRLG